MKSRNRGLSGAARVGAALLATVVVSLLIPNSSVAGTLSHKPKSASSNTLYHVTVLPTLGGNTALARAVNNFGQAAGWSGTNPNPNIGTDHAFFYSGGVMTDLGSFGYYSYAWGMNNLGQVVGRGWAGSQELGFVWSAGQMTTLPSLGGTFCEPHAINDAGQIAGISSLFGDKKRRAFRYSGGAMADLGTLGGNNSEAYAINRLGHVVGRAQVGNGKYHAFLHNGAAMVDLSTLGGTSSSAGGVNDLGQVVGQAMLAGDVVGHAFLYSGGVMTDLGTLGGGGYSSASAINASGEIVGAANNALGDQKAYLYRDGVMNQLDTLLDASSQGFDISNAFAISDSGHIVAEDFWTGYALLLTPVPADPDFAVYATPESQTVLQGGVTSYAIDTFAQGGFADSVDLTVSGLPAGVSATFSPPTVTAGSGSTMNVTTAANTPVGTYTLTVTGASGTLVRTDSVTLVVNPASPPDFTIAAAPASQTVTRGGSAAYAVTITGLNGFTGAVSFTCTGGPSTVTFSPTTVTGTGSTTMTARTRSSTQRKAYTLTIRGTSGSLTHTTTVTLIVQ